jgi:hypothetical protein
MCLKKWEPTFFHVSRHLLFQCFFPSFSVSFVSSKKTNRQYSGFVAFLLSQANGAVSEQYFLRCRLWKPKYEQRIPETFKLMNFNARNAWKYLQKFFFCIYLELFFFHVPKVLVIVIFWYTFSNFHSLLICDKFHKNPVFYILIFSILQPIRRMLMYCKSSNK